MEADHPRVTQYDDSRVTAEAGASQSIVRVNLVGMDRALFTALALTLSIFSVIYAFEAGRQQAQSVYWLQRNEAFLEQLSAQGVHVPSDLLHHKEK